jgi:hypothetical protein
LSIVDTAAAIAAIAASSGALVIGMDELDGVRFAVGDKRGEARGR